MAQEIDYIQGYCEPECGAAVSASSDYVQRNPRSNSEFSSFWVRIAALTFFCSCLCCFSTISRIRDKLSSTKLFIGPGAKRRASEWNDKIAVDAAILQARMSVQSDAGGGGRRMSHVEMAQIEGGMVMPMARGSISSMPGSSIAPDFNPTGYGREDFNPTGFQPTGYGAPLNSEEGTVMGRPVAGDLRGM
jgi:hypothetical protein